MRLTNAMIFVKDFPRMSAFYRQMLRLEPVNTEWTDRWALFETGGADFALHAIPPEALGDGDAGVHARANDELVAAPGQKPRETSPVKLTFTVDDVRAERARLEALGIPVIQRPWQEPDVACDGVDPEGNIFQITRSA